MRGAVLPAMLVVLAALPARAELRARAVRVAEAPEIDGDLSDAAWKQAPAIDAFTQRRPDEKAAPTYRTTARLAYDDHALYVAFRCDDPEPNLIDAPLVRRDRYSFSDNVSFDLDTAGDHQASYYFEVSAAGVQRDAIRTGDNALAWDWDAVWSSAVEVDAHGWSAEIAIPFSSLRFPPEDVQPWRLQLRRFLARRVESDWWVFLPRTQSGELFHYAPVDGVRALPQPHGVKLQPFVLGRARSRGAPAGIDAPRGKDGAWDAGLDGQLALTSGLTLSLTALPDFGQVEADQVMLNLSTFELRFPEKRPFFLEGADQLTIPDANGDPQSTQLFYSRRIGAAAPDPSLPTGTNVLDAPERIRIWGAAKVNGTIGEHVRLALLDAVTAREDALVQAGSGPAVKESLAPTSNYFVSRLRGSFGNLVLGGSAASVLRDETQALGLGGLCLDGTTAPHNGRCTHDALTGAFDAAWHDDTGGLFADVTVLGSRIAGGPARTLPDGVTIQSGDTGLGWRAELQRTEGRWLFDWVDDGATTKLDLNDAGYLRAANYHRGFARDVYRRFDVGPLREMDLGLDLWARNSIDGAAVTRGMNLNAWLQLRNEWSAWLEITGNPRTEDNRETRDGTRMERPATFGGDFGIGNPPTAKVATSIGGDASNTWKGTQLDGWASLRVYATRRLELSLSPSVSWLDGDPRWIETDPETYLFGLQRAATASVTGRGAFSFTPNLSLQGYAQVFFSSVTYDTLYTAPLAPAGVHPWGVRLDGLTPLARDPALYASRGANLNLNLLLRWEFRPGSLLYLVYTQARDGSDGLLEPEFAGRPRPFLAPAALAHGTVEHVLLAKVSYYFAR